MCVALLAGAGSGVAVTRIATSVWPRVSLVTVRFTGSVTVIVRRCAGADVVTVVALVVVLRLWVSVSAPSVGSSAARGNANVAHAPMHTLLPSARATACRSIRSERITGATTAEAVCRVTTAVEAGGTGAQPGTKAVNSTEVHGRSAWIGRDSANSGRRGTVGASANAGLTATYPVAHAKRNRRRNSVVSESCVAAASDRPTAAHSRPTASVPAANGAHGQPSTSRRNESRSVRMP
mmetsp:Transcript_27067/g.83823  ORF Transcript_27067/g.83823 Transcript_27067/m.83823 type:complete len:236 (+) Transcript_27067:754-1461(+)